MRDQVHLELQELRTRGTQVQEELAVTQQQLQQARVENRNLGEQYNLGAQNLQEAHSHIDEMLRAELVNAQDNLMQMTEARVSSNRRTQ
eukprot:5179258-Amphidinium_carterae.1